MENPNDDIMVTLTVSDSKNRLSATINAADINSLNKNHGINSVSDIYGMIMNEFKANTNAEKMNG